MVNGFKPQTYAIIARQAFSHLRHSAAHFFMCSSLGTFSHASAHPAHTSAQALQISSANGPLRATICDAAAQTSAQSWQLIKVAMCSFLPPSSSSAQCVPQLSHSRWQSEHALAHDSAFSPWAAWWACFAPRWANADPSSPASANADTPAMPNSRRFIKLALPSVREKGSHEAATVATSWQRNKATTSNRNPRTRTRRKCRLRHRSQGICTQHNRNRMPLCDP